MDILFENESEWGKIEIKILKKFVFLKYDMSIILNSSVIFSIVAGLFVLVLFTSAIWALIQEKVYFGAFVLTAVIILAIIKGIKDNKKKQDKIDKYIVKYEFYNEYVVINTQNINSQSITTSKIYYNEILIENICIYKGYIFFMMPEKHFWIINENTFTLGDKDEFQKFISDKFNKKVKKYN